jgi:serine/threonine protein kinase
MALQSIPLSAIVDIGVGAPASAPRTVAAAGGVAGRRLGPYLLLDRLGAGACATVYRARHELIGIDRAVKVLEPPAALVLDQRERFVREARLAATLRHPNVVTVIDCGVEPGGAAYIVMEYVAGPTLAERLGAGVPPASDTLRIAGQVAAALDHAHGAGIVHRDVKPANILLGTEAVARLGDFGIAWLERDPEPVAAAVLLGTPAYMSPEQCQGVLGRLGPPSDVYSLAVVLYEMLTGRTPYGHGRTALDGHLRQGPPPAPSAVNPYLPPEVDAVLAAGMAREPAARPASAGRLVAQLAAALDAECQGARWFEPAAPSAGPPAPALASADGLWSPPAASVPSGLGWRLAQLVGGRRRP